MRAASRVPDVFPTFRQSKPDLADGTVVTMRLARAQKVPRASVKRGSGSHRVSVFPPVTGRKNTSHSCPQALSQKTPEDPCFSPVGYIVCVWGGRWELNPGLCIP